MKEYSLIVKFLYKGSKYQLLTDTDDKYFFLKINNNKYSYVTFEEFIKLCNIFCRHSSCLLATNDNKKIKILPKVIIGGVATVLTASSISIAGAFLNYKEMIDKYDAKYSDSIVSEEIQSSISFVTEDSSEELSIDTIIDNQYSNSVYVYDMEYLDNYLDYDNVSKKQLLEVLDDNKKISEKFKIMIREFIDSVYDKYPDIDMRVFYENLKTLQIVECDKSELMLKSLSVDSYACYVRSENVIYTLKDYIYEKGTWEYQVIMHELAHVIRNGFFKCNDKEIRVSATGNSLSLITVDEALNSIFAVSLLGYEENDIAYQLQSNYSTIMLECLDNYSLSDYINHSLSYYAKKLDEYNGDNNYAKSILTLIDAQYKDFHSKEIEVEQEEYYPIYDYIANMYYKKYINNSMSYGEAKNVADNLVNRIMFDVPEEYNIDTGRFYDCLDEYCFSVGIDVNSKSRNF